ncbi:HET-domain-containing protein [Didymella exigua CBS 183.55]|uniref:HET-domain-containing protein n=1 Tax=Didymella exigua CBS 183.55 TaxID=1150837 RepID=A0A6A5RBJ4_9PLEO|nr:HET-domain-containing protein [Didymella exigua CBS 183.55]KAF1924719.1 HET-domain-containing protein [Didymella exigua CBS 183.55]
MVLMTHVSSARQSHTIIDPTHPSQGNDGTQNCSHSSSSTLPANPASEQQEHTHEPSTPAIDLGYIREEISKILDSNPIGLDPEGEYAPDRELERLLSVINVRAVLGGDAGKPLEDYALRERGTFATLLLMHYGRANLKKAMQAFQSSAFTDAILQSKDLALCDPDPCGRDCRHHFPKPPWNSASLRDLKKTRWHFLVPKFDHKIFEYDVQPEQYLPFKRSRKKPQQRAEGFFSTVSCVEMLSDKQDAIRFTKRPFIDVALKELQRVILPSGRPYDIRQEWLREVKAHKELSDVHAHLVQGIAAYRTDANDSENEKYCIVLEWADGGNLRSFWNSNTECQLNDDPSNNRYRIKAMLGQFLGLAECLELMHTRTTQRESFDEPDLDTGLQHVDQQNPSRSQVSFQPKPKIAVQGTDEFSVTEKDPRLEYWRHGDIKPENILRFIKGDDKNWLGTLKLADLGRAQQHAERTAMRQSAEREQFRTVLYEPPDLYDDKHKNGQGQISRLFDVWSMGCVIFECVVWMLYGAKTIASFQDNPTIKKYELVGTPYWIIDGANGYKLTDRLTAWMQHISEDSTGYSNALGDLVRLVRDKLLVIKLPQDSELPAPGTRISASNMRKEIELIVRKAAENDDYLFSRANKFVAQPPPADRSNTSLLLPRSHGSPEKQRDSLMVPGASTSRPTVGGAATTLAESRVYTDTVRDTWLHLDDNTFAGSVSISDHPHDDDALCSKCQQIDLVSDQFNFDRKDIEATINKCRLCALVPTVLARTGIGAHHSVNLTRDFDHFTVLQSDAKVTKVLRVCRTDESSDSSLQELPRGAPNLFGPSDLGAFVRLPHAWLKDCDGHSTCHPKRDQSILPVRLVCVKDVDRPKIVDSAAITGDTTNERYIAFSHKWGDKHFPTTTSHNLAARRELIPKDELPQSFIDAIKVTKALGCDYLWIDSLCINQGSDGDFDAQASSMQNVYSNAYCVIAASKAEGATEGFLFRKNGLASAGSVRKSGVYVSAITNDFTRDVLESPLNRRGWAFQERALARRTIFFTATQMYWECGHGIRCETLAKLGHDEIAFLGDANFPSKAIDRDGSRGTQIHIWTSIFKDYALLDISRPPDRSVAIEGLMARLAGAFKTASLYGLFRRFWGRCLLWRRPQNGLPMRRVLQEGYDIKLAPTWSWMAVLGGIDFLSPEGGQVLWNSGIDLPPALNKDSPQRQQKTLPQRPTDSIAEEDAIIAPAYRFTAASQYESEQGIYYDDDTTRADEKVRAVIICTSQEQDDSKKEHHVLLVLEAMLTTVPPTYERIGVGLLPETCIDRRSRIEIAIG